MSYQSKAFKSLKDEWYQKLKESGFDDIEDNSSGGNNLKRYSSFKCAKGNEAKFEIAKQYDSEDVDKIYKAEGLRFAATFIFRNDTDREVWALHLCGLSTRKIANQLKTPRYNCVSVHTLIVKIKMEFLFFLKSQLNEKNPNKDQLFLFEDQAPAYLLHLAEELR